MTQSAKADLSMVHAAGYSVAMTMWKDDGIRPYMVSRVALAVCTEPEKHNEDVLDWAMEALER